MTPNAVPSPQAKTPPEPASRATEPKLNAAPESVSLEAVIASLGNKDSAQHEDAIAWIAVLTRNRNLSALTRIARGLEIEAKGAAFSRDRFLKLIGDQELTRKVSWALDRNMQYNDIHVHPSKAKLPRNKQLAWHIAEMAASTNTVTEAARETVINRLIDNYAVGLAALNDNPVIIARSMARPGKLQHGATIIGLSQDQLAHPRDAGFANGTAARQLDWHDCFLAADYSHPADNIPMLLAVAQSRAFHPNDKPSGEDLIRAVVVAYETQVNLVREMCLHQGSLNKIDHILHLSPAIAAGLGSLLKLSPEVIYQAVQETVHVAANTRQSRTGELSEWKAHAPAHAGRLAFDAINRAMLGGTSPSPCYEGQAGTIMHLLGGVDAHYHIPMPIGSSDRLSILDTYPKEHSAEYQAQALIDLAFKMRQRIPDYTKIQSIVIHTSKHTHVVIGTGPNEPQKMNPNATRETLDHSIMYIFARALRDGTWHHQRSYQNTNDEALLKVWHATSTVEDPAWTQRYHSTDPAVKAFGGKVVIKFEDGSVIEDEMAVANAHNLGATPWNRRRYEQKFRELTNHICSDREQARVLETLTNLASLRDRELYLVNPVADLVTANMFSGGLDDRGPR